MKKYRYTATTATAFTIGDKEHVLQPGEVYELPADDDNVRSRVAQRHLEEVTDPKPEAGKGAGNKE